MIAPVSVCLRVGVQSLGQAKIGDLGLAVRGQQHVGRLQVAVDDVAAVRLAHGEGEIVHHRGGLARRLRLAADLVREAAAGDELEREIRESVMLAHLVDLNDPRMLELGDGLRFDGEPRELLGRGVAPESTIFRATRRSRPICCALYTTPIPPRPITSRIT